MDARSPEMIGLSLRVAITLASDWRRAGWQGHWRELWGAAWEGLARHLEEGGDPRHAAQAAAYWVMEYGRRLHGRAGSLARQRRVHISLSDLAARTLRDHRAVVTPSTQTLRDWCDTRYARQDLDLRRRLWLYLLAVEGWTQDAIARLWGCSPSLISSALLQSLTTHYYRTRHPDWRTSA